MNEISDISIIKGFIDTYSLALTALAFIVYTICVKKITAFNLVVLALIILHIVHSQITRGLVPLFGVERYEAILGYIWYLSFGLTDILFIIVCREIIQRYELSRDRFSSLILIIIGFVASLQFIDLALTRFGINVFADIYTNGVILSNIAITVIPWLMSFRIILVRSGVVSFIKKEV